MIKHEAFTPAQAEQIMVAAGQLAVQRARHAFEQGIVDPMSLRAGLGQELASASFIDYVIRSEEGLGWGGRQPYRYNGDDFEWCGAFVAYCMPWIDAELREVYWSSTDRLNAYAQHKLLFGTTRERALAERFPVRDHEDGWTSAYARQYAKFDEHSVTGPLEARAGDILLCGPAFAVSGFRSHGSHVALIEGQDVTSMRWALSTFEGNAYGEIPGRPETRSKPVQGVIHTKRPVGLTSRDPRTHYHVRRWIRPSFFDVDLTLFLKFGGELPSTT